MNILNYYKSANSDRAMISFIGTITPMLIDEIMLDVETKLQERQENIKVIKKVYNTLLETLQNLYHHTDQNISKMPEANHSCICIVYDNDYDYSIIAGNYIKNEKVEGFKALLDKLSNLSKEQLKEYYLEVLNNGQRSDKDGAGLGMIEISRKSGDRIKYEFIKLEDDYSLFVLNVKVLKMIGL